MPMIPLKFAVGRCAWLCSVEEAATEVERKAVTTDGGGLVAERLQRSIIELRKVVCQAHSAPRKSRLFALSHTPCQHPCHALWMQEQRPWTYEHS